MRHERIFTQYASVIRKLWLRETYHLQDTFREYYHSHHKYSIISSTEIMLWLRENKLKLLAFPLDVVWRWFWKAAFPIHAKTRGFGTFFWDPFSISKFLNLQVDMPFRRVTPSVALRSWSWRHLRKKSEVSQSVMYTLGVLKKPVFLPWCCCTTYISTIEFTDRDWRFQST